MPQLGKSQGECQEIRITRRVPGAWEGHSRGACQVSSCGRAIQRESGVSVEFLSQKHDQEEEVTKQTNDDENRVENNHTEQEELVPEEYCYIGYLDYRI